MEHHTQGTKAILLILAHNEERVLAATLEDLRTKAGNQVGIHVVADRCSDRTAQIARSYGVQVHVRFADTGPTGKGAALRWWLERTRDGSADDQAIIVLDADSRISDGFLPTVLKRLEAGARAMQSRIEPQFSLTSPVSVLAALSETVEHRVFDRLRKALNWPVRLRGTGMVFKRCTLEMAASRLLTLVEDVELTLVLAAADVQLEYLPDVFVYDPKPERKKEAIQQRARWLKGQMQVIREHPGRIFSVARKGLSGLSLLSSIFIKPRTFFFPIKLGLLSGALMAAASSHQFQFLGWVIAGALTLGILVEISAFLYGLRYMPNPKAITLALFLLPLYLIVWTGGLLHAFLSNDPWPRARPRTLIPLFDKPGSAHLS